MQSISHLGKPVRTKMDEFSEKILQFFPQTGYAVIKFAMKFFRPEMTPPPFLKFFRKFMTKITVSNAKKLQ